MSKIIVILLFLSVAVSGLAQETNAKVSYKNAFDELHQMLKGDLPISFKRAVFLTENAYYNNQLKYEDFTRPISALVSFTKAVAAADGLNYNDKDRQQTYRSGSAT